MGVAGDTLAHVRYRLRVIIPTLNESGSLRATIASLRSRAALRHDPALLSRRADDQPPHPHLGRSADAGSPVDFESTWPHQSGIDGFDLVVSDCGSTDGTPDIARQCGATVVEGACCRADALNRGVAASTPDPRDCEVLLFLHADTALPEAWDLRILRAIGRHGIVGGAFDFNFASHPLNHGWNRQGLRFVKLLNRLRFRWTHNFYGDQAIFVRRSVFDRVGGFPRVRLMEDIGFSRRMRSQGRVAIIRPGVKTSPRRFVVTGVWRQFARDLNLLSLDAMGLRPRASWHRYNLLNARSHARSDKLAEPAGPVHSAVVPARPPAELAAPVTGGPASDFSAA